MTPPRERGKLSRMRGLPAVVLAIAAGGVAAMAGPPAPTTTWADWVGDWDGRLKWHGCTFEGHGSATLPIEATDGVLTIDLAGAGNSLGALALTEDANAWVGQQGDVTVHVTRGKDGVDVAVDLESGCAIRTSARRATTGIAACDRLDGWARIEARCTRLGKPPLENEARVVRQHETWTAARGEARAKIAAQCEARAAKVEAELIDVGCAPNPDPAIGLRGAACQAMHRSATKLGRCASMPSGLASAITAKADAYTAAAQSANDANLPTVEAQCTQFREEIVGVAQRYGCPP